MAGRVLHYLLKKVSMSIMHVIRDNVKTWPEPDVHCVSVHHVTRLTLTLTHHKLTLVCANEAPI